jgi:hypothetical protein
VYWSRFLIALATGVGSVFALRGVVGGDLATLAYPTLAILVYALTAVVYRDLLGYGEAQLKGKSRYITLGIGTFVFAWLAGVILTYTLLGLH